jgi:hypothetical protein
MPISFLVASSMTSTSDVVVRPSTAPLPAALHMVMFLLSISDPVALQLLVQEVVFHLILSSCTKIFYRFLCTVITIYSTESKPTSLRRI